MNPEDYMLAVSGEGDPILVANWKDKPHRLVYDLVGDSLTLRKLLWLRHGCTGLYGDDGEMQCGTCMIDFKRMSSKDIETRFLEIGLAKLSTMK